MKESNLKDVLQFENHQVSVWKTHISPQEPLTTDHASHLLVCLQAGRIQKCSSTGEIQTLDLEPLSTYVLEGKHICSTEHSLEVMVIKVKSPQDRLLPSIPID